MSLTAKASQSYSKHLYFMDQLGPLVSLYRPSETSNSKTQHHPRLIVIAGWTDARDVHIAKVIAKYQVLYPAAGILLLRSTMSCIIRPSQIDPAMNVAASVLYDTFKTPIPSSSSPPLLVHMFSNGGSSSITHLYQQFAALSGPGEKKSLPPHVTIFDSCPGRFSIPCSVAFVSVGLSSLQRLIVAPLLYAFAAFWTASMALGILPNSLDDWYQSHNHHEGNMAELRRVYIYSSGDTLTSYKDVEIHASEAEAEGFSIALERFEGSAHVGHMRKDEDRYWKIIAKAMKE